MDAADRFVTVADAFASAIEGFVREVRAEVPETNAAAADAERRLNNLLRLEAALSAPASPRLDAAE